MGRFQFSLRMMLAAVAVVGIGAALWTAEPSWQVGAVEVLLLAWVPGAAMTLSVHSSGKARTFWLGFTAEIVLTIVLLKETFPTNILGMQLSNSGPFDSLRIFLHAFPNAFRLVLLAWAFAPIVGLLCGFTHWLLIRPPEPEA
jgi:hypothetical protein